MSINKTATQDAQHVRTGKDGALFLNTGENLMLLSSCNEFRISISFNNADWQPVSSGLIYAVPTGYTVTISLTDAVITDEYVSSKVFENLEESGPRADSRTFEFQTLLEAKNGRDQRILVKGCIPDGDVDLLNITPGEIVQHQWTFRCNATPKVLDKLSLDYLPATA